MESKCCIFLAQPMYKRNKVSAFRDFPEGCGRYASRVIDHDTLLGNDDAEVARTAEEAVIRKSLKNFPFRRVSAVRDFPHLCGNNASLLCEVESLNGVMEKNVEDRDGCNGRVVDTVECDSEGGNVAVEKEEDLSLLGKCFTIPEESYPSEGEVDLKTEVDEGNCDDADEIGRTASGKEDVVFQEVQDHGTKKSSDELKGGFDGYRVALPPCGTVVLALMAPSKRPLRELNSKKVMESNGDDVVETVGISRKENVVSEQEVQDPGTKPLDASDSQHELKGGLDESQAVSPPHTTMMAALMAESRCPRRNGGKRKQKKFLFLSQLNLNADIKTNNSKIHTKKPSQKKKKGNAASEATGQLVIWKKNDSLYPSDSNVTRNKVRETLHLFQVESRKLLRDKESKPKGAADSSMRIDLQAAKILERKGKYLNTGKILGPVPGVEVGDEFQYRVELNIVGLHQQIQGDIDYVKHNGKILGTSIIASGGYSEELDDSDVLLYTGLCVTGMKTDKEPGNLALKNSIEEKNPVRVIRCSESTDRNCKTFIYDGQYIIEACWRYTGPDGKLFYRFQLRRMPDQPELSWNEVKKSKRFKTREGLCVDDISHGKELFSICAVNTIDDQTPPQFEYITRMIYPNWCNPIPPNGCDCADGCSSSNICSCTVKNGGVIPFNHDGAIVEEKPLVFECGISCKCPPTCPNRVSQHGIKLQLEIFKTKSRGWGVRSLNSIPSGTFICEYIGELLAEDEAEERVGNDEYLFDIGNSNCSHSLWNGLPMVLPDEAQLISCDVVEDGGFTIDAARYGNVGRFINHSCSPNLYAQNVLYDHDDKRIPHIMLFAFENIPPLQELTYDYNYKIDQVFDSDGNIKKKYCYCGSVECTGRMY